jgi:hypothetical protein
VGLINIFEQGCLKNCLALAWFFTTMDAYAELLSECQDVSEVSFHRAKVHGQIVED